MTRRLRSLVLNSTFEALNTVSAGRALQLLLEEKAALVEAYDRVLRSASASFSIPSVIVLRKYVKRPPPRQGVASFSRMRVLERDGFTCQYCGCADLTKMSLDHVIPRSKGGGTDFFNVVTACRRCNQKKANKLLSETNLTLRRQPSAPPKKPVGYVRHQYTGLPAAWVQYM